MFFRKQSRLSCSPLSLDRPGDICDEVAIRNNSVHSIDPRTLTPTLDIIDVSKDEKEKRGRELFCRVGNRRESLGCRN